MSSIARCETPTSAVSDSTDCSRLPSSTLDGKAWPSGSGSAPPFGAVRPDIVPGRTKSTPGREFAEDAPSPLQEENSTCDGIPSHVPSVSNEEATGDRQSRCEAGVQECQGRDAEDPEDSDWLDSLAWDGSVHPPGEEAHARA